MTERLYYTNSRLQVFEARIVGGDPTRVVLDVTAFYPTSGGQPHDLGTLAGVPVVDVIDDGPHIVHVLAAPLPDPGDAPVHGVIDWPRRLDHMQQHTGQHLLSAVFADRFGWPTTSVHFGADVATLDLAVEQITPGDLERAEQMANDLVMENRPVHVTFEDADAVQGLRKASERGGTLRVVSIDGVDRSACGGTHVAATGEIGPILVRRQERMKRQTRVEFVCGRRAIARARRDYQALSAMAVELSAAIDDVPALLGAQGRSLRAAETELRRQGEELAAFRARATWEATVPDAQGIRWISESAPGASAESVRQRALALAALPATVVAVVMPEARSILLASSPDAGVDAGARIKQAMTTVGGRGGGSARLAQGSVPDATALPAAWAALDIPLEYPVS